MVVSLLGQVGQVGQVGQIGQIGFPGFLFYSDGKKICRKTLGFAADLTNFTLTATISTELRQRWKVCHRPESWS